MDFYSDKFHAFFPDNFVMKNMASTLLQRPHFNRGEPHAGPVSLRKCLSIRKKQIRLGPFAQVAARVLMAYDVVP